MRLLPEENVFVITTSSSSLSSHPRQEHSYYKKCSNGFQTQILSGSHFLLLANLQVCVDIQIQTNTQSKSGMSGYLLPTFCQSTNWITPNFFYQRRNFRKIGFEKSFVSSRFLPQLGRPCTGIGSASNLGSETPVSLQRTWFIFQVWC